MLHYINITLCFNNKLLKPNSAHLTQCFYGSYDMKLETFFMGTKVIT